jgi:hypothetical protein
VILDPTTGEVTQTIPAAAPSSSSSISTTTSSSSSSSAPTGSGSGSGKGGGSKTITIKLPKVTYKAKVNGDKLTLTFTTKGGSKVSTLLRLRAYHAGHLIANRAATARNHHAKFRLKLNEQRTGTYRFVVSIDTGGKVGELTRSVRVH